MTHAPPPDRRDPQPSAPEKEMLAAFLDYHRATLLWKVNGLSDADVRRPMTPSGLTLLGLVKHLAYVERWWFQAVFTGADVAFPWTEADPDADWRGGLGGTTAAGLTPSLAEGARPRGIAPGAGPPDRAPRPGQDPTLG